MFILANVSSAPDHESISAIVVVPSIATVGEDMTAVIDENTELVPLEGRCSEDDRRVGPQSLYMLLFSHLSVDALCFEPRRGADQARGYAERYCAKLEAWYVNETEGNGLRERWLNDGRCVFVLPTTVL